jgi:hypothetical protein
MFIRDWATAVAVSERGRARTDARRFHLWDVGIVEHSLHDDYLNLGGNGDLPASHAQPCAEAEGTYAAGMARR